MSIKKQGVAQTILLECFCLFWNGEHLLMKAENFFTVELDSLKEMITGKSTTYKPGVLQRKQNFSFWNLRLQRRKKKKKENQYA